MGDSTEFARKLITPYAERIEELEEEVERLLALCCDMWNEPRDWTGEYEATLREFGIEIDEIDGVAHFVGRANELGTTQRGLLQSAD